MPDPFMPDVQVEIAFNAGYTTPAASRVWTDVSAYVELDQLIDIVVGRQDERSTADANQLTLTLDNSDGRFTAQRTASPYYPNVKVGRPIRVRVTPPGGTASTRYVGFVNEWPVEWDGSDTYAQATITASSRLSRLGSSSSLRSMPEEAILAPSTPPAGYWTLGDPTDAVEASESSGRGAPSLVRNPANASPAVVFGEATGPGFDGMTAARFAVKQCLRADFQPSDGRFTLRAAVLLEAVPAFDAWVVSLGLNGLRVNTSGQIAGIATVGPSINDGATHDVMLTREYDGLGWSEGLWLDGALVDSATGAPTPFPSYGSVFVGINFPGVIAHAAVWSYDLSASNPTSIPDQAQAILTGYAGDRTDQRVGRLLDWAHVAATERTLQAGAETMTHQSTSGSSVVDALRQCESTEYGVLFDGRDGNVTFQSRSARYLKTAAATLNMAAQHVGAGYLPKLDRSTLVNDVTASNPSTGQSARALATASADEYGVAAGSTTSLAQTADALLQLANWQVASYATPRVRVPSLSVDILAHQGLTPSAQTLLAVNVGDVLAVTNAPVQADSSSASYFVEGYVEVIGPESYSITYNLSPSYPTLNTFVLGDATRGKLDDAYVLAP